MLVARSAQKTVCRCKRLAQVIAIAQMMLFLGLVSGKANASNDAGKVPILNASDDRSKADFLLVLAHEDDDTAFSGFLARAVYDQRRKGAAIFITRGDAGESAVGPERGDALGAVREIEARHALAYLGITNVWFLHAPNGPNTQNVLHILEYWDHGSILGQIVRLVRLTRPDVILSMFPGVVAGENHPDHQASGVLATEAFDLAADPVSFPEQLATAVNDNPAGHNPEGLHPWQPKKIYFWADALDSGTSQWVNPPPASPFRRNFLEGAGPVYLNKELSPSQHVPYARIAAEHASFYESQDGLSARAALVTGNLKDFEAPERYILGKNLVQGSVTGDVFEGIMPGAIPLARQERSNPVAPRKLWLGFGGAWKFYHDFWAAHGLERLEGLLPVPEVSLRMGTNLEVPLILQNDSDSPQDVHLETILPEAWSSRARHSVYPLKPGDSYPLSLDLRTPTSGKTGWQEIQFIADANGRQIGLLTLRVCLRAPAQP